MAAQSPKKDFRGFHGGEPHFRAARTRCALACRRYNSLPEDATAEQRAAAWRHIVASNRSERKSLLVDPKMSAKAASSASSTSLVTPPTTPHKTTASFPPDLMEVPALEDSALSQSIDAPSLGGPTLAVKASRPHAPTPTPSPPRQQDVSSTELQQPDSAESLIATPKSTDTPHINYYPGYGETPYIKTPLYIDYGINLHIGGTTFINRGCTVLDTPVSEVRIGERCSIGPNVSFFGVSHPLDPKKRQDATYPESSVGADIIVGDDCWIGGNVTVLAGVTIGAACVIGAGSVVTKSIPPNCVAYGVPARVRKTISTIDNAIGGSGGGALATLLPPAQLHKRGAEQCDDTSSLKTVELALKRSQPPPLPPARLRSTDALLTVIILLLSVAITLLGLMLTKG